MSFNHQENSVLISFSFLFISARVGLLSLCALIHADCYHSIFYYSHQQFDTLGLVPAHSPLLVSDSNLSVSQVHFLPLEAIDEARSSHAASVTALYQLVAALLQQQLATKKTEITKLLEAAYFDGRQSY